MILETNKVGKLAGLDPDMIKNENGVETYVYKFENVQHKNQVLAMSAQIFFLTRRVENLIIKVDELENSAGGKKKKAVKSIPRGSDHRGRFGGTREL